MSQKLFIFIGNDETLKNQLYYQITGINQLEKEENYNCFPSLIKKPPQFQEKKYQILNTPPIKTKEDHKKLWSLIAAICQCHKLIIEDVFYCILNQNQLNLDILNDLTDLFYYNSNQNGIYFFTKSIDAQNQISSKIKNQICYLCRNPTDFLNIFEQLSRRQNKFFFTLCRIEKLKINENDEIICLINAISNELKKLLIQPINQVQFIQKFFQKEQLESILNSIYFNFDKIQSIFESRVKIKLSLDQLYNQIVSNFFKLYTSTFYLCQECLQFYFCEKSILYRINLLKPQILIADSNSNKSKFKCINCQNQISYTSYQLIFQACFDDLQQRISLKLQYEFENQPLYIQKPNTEPLQEMHNVYQETNLNRKIIENENIKFNDATQILFLSNEDDQRRIIFNTLIEYKNQKRVKIDNNIFINGYLSDGKCRYVFHNPPLFDFEISNMDVIASYKKYFSKNIIHHFVFFLNYQRTDLIKQRFFDMFKKLPNLNKLQVSIIVTQCDSNVDQLEDLKQEFQKFSFNSIILLNKLMNQTQIKSQILECFSKVNPIQFRFQGTIFEEDNVEEDKRIENNFKVVLDQIENDKMEELQIQYINNDQEIQDLKYDIEQQEKLLKQKKEKLRDLIQENETDKHIIQKWYYKRQQQKETSQIQQ